MLLSDQDIAAELKSGRIEIDPSPLNNIQPSSVDVHLGEELCVYLPGQQWVDPREDQAKSMQRITMTRPFLLRVDDFALASTVERLTLPDDRAARFEGKSSIGRLGLLPHVAAGFIDPGFSGWITLELHNVSGRPFLLIPGMKIGQLCFFQLSSPAAVPYGSSSIGSRYQGQQGPTTSRFHLNYS